MSIEKRATQQNGTVGEGTGGKWGRKKIMLADHKKNRHVTDEKSSEQRATQRKRDVRQSERKTRNETKRDGGKGRAGNEVGKNYVSRPQQKLNQTT